MKIKEEQKEVLKAVSKKVSDKIAEDVKSTEASSLKRPIVMALVVIAAVGIIRDPSTLLIGILASIAVVTALSTSKEDVKIIINSLKKDSSEKMKKVEEKEEEKK